MIMSSPIFASLRRTGTATLTAAAVSLAALALATAPAKAQQSVMDSDEVQERLQALEQVAAVVNDTVISTFDVRQRIQLIAMTSGGRIPEEAMGQVQAKAVQDLVEEQLKIEEAASLDFEINEDEVNEELARIAGNAGGTIEDLERDLNSSGISIETVRRQIHTRLLWQRLVTARYGSRINIAQSEIDEVMSRLRDDVRDEQYRVAEICLPLREDTNVAQIEQAAMQIIGQMQQGAPFETLARQFSACNTAANGGDLGWLRAGELDPELGNVVEQMEPGQVSRPISHDGMVRIFAVREKREAAQQGTQTYELGYASIPVSAGEETARSTFARLPESNLCSGGALSFDLGPDVEFELLPMLPASELQTPFREPVSELERLEQTGPIRSGGYYHAALLCAKDEGLGLPSRAQIEDRLFEQELELLSRRYLRDVEREASVQIRLGSQNADG